MLKYIIYRTVRKYLVISHFTHDKQVGPYPALGEVGMEE